ncbi:unnamed protein product [Schistosoma margrebowiei]|uniref:10 kDa heat shock protein, mitochondrial n=1 Tax=Schistosoma margrebowiei TaxID=48269 RepID=A0AA85AMR0_9TREM|nr:unnamed protein product [Schistosoma margrebowiei]
MAARAFKKFAPLYDRVLVQRFEAETRSKGGIMIPEKAKGKVLEATVVAHGPGSRNEVKLFLCVSMLVTRFSFLNTVVLKSYWTKILSRRLQ